MKHLMSCREAVQHLWRFLDEELDSAEYDQVEAHLEHCVRCCGELEFVRELRGILGAQETIYLPHAVADRLGRFVDELTDDTADHGSDR